MSIRLVLIALSLFSTVGVTNAQTVAEGKSAFTASCAACHSIDGTAKSMGPTMKGIVGRKAASNTQYKNYSAALKKSNITWTATELDAYLKAPMTRVKGTSMVTAVQDQKRRQAIIVYLKSLR
jgi:cytochrome c